MDRYSILALISEWNELKKLAQTDSSKKIAQDNIDKLKKELKNINKFV